MSGLSDAIESFNKGEGARWCQAYLRGEGRNEKLAEHLRDETHFTIHMIEFPLNRLIRIIGPEAGMIYREDPDIWEKRIVALVDVIRTGAELEPLIITDLWGPLEIADGNHRHAALKRCGRDKYWTLFFFARSESAKLLDVA